MTKDHPLLNRFNQTNPEPWKKPLEKAKQQKQNENQPEPSDKKPGEQQEKD
jgi:hypothetical protein